MAQPFDLPTSATLREAEQILLPRLRGDDSPIWEAFPEEYVEEYDLIWEQEDSYVGLQQVRGLGGRPNRVARVGGKRFMQQPGVYGEMITLDERELTIRRRWATFGVPITVEDLVARAQKQLITRRINRIEKMLWDLAINGSFSVIDPVTKAVKHTDNYTPNSYTASVAWSNHSTATPIQDIRLCQLRQRGQSVSFGPDARLWINQSTWIDLISNTNTNDLGGRRLLGLTPANGLPQINQILQAENLPGIAIYDGHYVDDGVAVTGTESVNLFIPNSTFLLIGRRRTGAPIGAFRYTLNVNTPGAEPRPYMRVFDRSTEQVPAEVEIHDGFNGGPLVYFPTAMVVGHV